MPSRPIGSATGRDRSPCHDAFSSGVELAHTPHALAHRIHHCGLPAQLILHRCAGLPTCHVASGIIQTSPCSPADNPPPQLARRKIKLFADRWPLPAADIRPSSPSPAPSAPHYLPHPLMSSVSRVNACKITTSPAPPSRPTLPAPLPALNGTPAQVSYAASAHVSGK